MYYFIFTHMEIMRTMLRSRKMEDIDMKIDRYDIGYIDIMDYIDRYRYGYENY